MRFAEPQHCYITSDQIIYNCLSYLCWSAVHGSVISEGDYATRYVMLTFDNINYFRGWIHYLVDYMDMSLFVMTFSSILEKSRYIFLT